MSSLTASPRSKKPYENSGHNGHSQVRQLHTGPSIAHSSLKYSPSTIQTAIGPITPSEPPSSSAGYFGFVVDTNDPAYAPHSMKNWSPAGSSIRSAAARSPLPVQVENPPTPFMRQTEVLAQKIQRAIATGKDTQVVESSGRSVDQNIRKDNPKSNNNNTSLGVVGNDYFSSIRIASPARVDFSDNEPWSTLSSPASVRPTLGVQSPLMKSPVARAATLPPPPKDGEPSLIGPTQLAELIKKYNTESLLLLDVRTYKSYVASRIKTAVNLCIPTTLLKRPSFNVAKLSDTFASNYDKKRFDLWKAMKYIVVYDTETKYSTDSSALAAIYTLSKFSREGWDGTAYILKGGFVAYSVAFPDGVDKSPIPNSSHTKGLTLNGGAGGTGKPVPAGSMFNCPLPTQQSIVNPFFSNIRQNLDLIDGVGEYPVHLPTTMGDNLIAQLPAWLKEVACNSNGSKTAADRFLKIEQEEQRRMQEALNVSVIYDSPTSTQQKSHTLAGVEKGTKNRYNNIWPYDHSRVRLQELLDGECDYVNASHISVPYSQKRYIASQAPLPSTFRDFWGMVWEQDVRVIVMLTAEEEGGRLKSHKYWETNEYGLLKLTRIQERKVSLEPACLKVCSKRRSVSTSSQPSSTDSSIPYIIVRKFTLEHTGSPFSPIREITQLQYSAWPDLGTPAHPSHVLALIEHTEAVMRASTPSEATPGRRPVLVHCSAGCGRTGTFCTVDSVINMLKRQRINRKHKLQQQIHDESSDGDDNMKMKRLGIEDEGDWISRDDEDLVFRAVSQFRDQRISMVQCLQQYVLCYETVLEWLAKQSPLDSGKRKA